MVLDEPTANLDAVTERKVMEALHPVFRDRAVIIISHRSAALEHVDQVMQLVSGRVVALAGSVRASPSPPRMSASSAIELTTAEAPGRASR